MTYDRMSHLVPIDDGFLAGQGDATWEALVAWSDHAEGEGEPPPLVVKEGALMRMTDRELEPYSPEALRSAMSRAAVHHITTNQGMPVPKNPPKDVVVEVLHRDPVEWTGVHRVQRVVNAPVFSVEGELINEPGLHANSGIWYRPDDPRLLEVDRFVGDIDDFNHVVGARDYLLNELLGEVPFADPESKANALGLLLLPIVREMIDGQTPLHTITAQLPGSGKTTLMNLCLTPALGNSEGSRSEPKNDEELRKAITTALLAGKHLLFDNINDKLKSGTLASALTAHTWTDRVLGVNREVSIPVRSIWVLTANNLRLTTELADRTVPIRLAAPDGIPARKRPANSWKKRKIDTWALEHRAELMGAAITLVQHWLAGSASVVRPDGTFERTTYKQDSPVSLGSFTAWSDVIGGILAAAHVEGFLGNIQDLEGEDFEGQENEEFITAWFEHLGSDPVMSSVLAGHCIPGGRLFDSLPSTVDVRNVSHSLKYWLRGKADTMHGDHFIRNKRIRRGRPQLWYVEKIGPK